jgi:hypothetical protein
MLHVIPLDDKIEHTPDCSCCNAHLDVDGFYIHHAVDKREQYERQGKKGKPWCNMWHDEATGEWGPLGD